MTGSLRTADVVADVDTTLLEVPAEALRATMVVPEIQRVVLAAYRALGCRGWGRADLMIRAADRRPFLLEMNTSPGMTGHSLVPKSAAAAGIGYEPLCVMLLAQARLEKLLAGPRPEEKSQVAA